MRYRRDFPKKVKAEAFLRAKGQCEACEARLWPGRIQYDHQLPDAFGGAPTLENCRVLCIGCHRTKTRTDASDIAKAKRREAKHLGFHRPRSGFSGWRKFNGEVVKR